MTRERIALVLECNPTDDRPAETRVRLLLKFALRTLGLKCVEIREHQQLSVEVLTATEADGPGFAVGETPESDKIQH